MFSRNSRAGLAAGALLLLGLPAADCAAQQVRMLVQSSPLAGARYYLARDVWKQLRAGDALRLEREPENAHDGNAVRVYWRDHMLGYVPKRENAALAWAMDAGTQLQARVSRLPARRGRKLEFDVYVE